MQTLIKDQVIAERLRIIEKIGRGGFGHVYKAWDEQLERTVAVKLLNVGAETEQEFLDRFLREAKISSALLHTDIARTYSYGLLDKVTPYLVLEYVDGNSLEDVLSKRGKLPVVEAVEIAIAILDGLHYAHLQGVVHRDMKPANVLMSDDLTKIKIIDFGLARRYKVDSTLTKTGFVQGTPQFMSPELIVGEVVDARTDIYAVGCMLSLMISGVLPFPGNNELEYLYHHLNSEPQLPKLPIGIAQSILRALEKDRDKRFATAAEFADDLRQCLKDPNSMNELLPAKQPPSARASGKLLPMAICTMLCLIGVAVFNQWHLLEPKPKSVTKEDVAYPQTAAQQRLASAARSYEAENYVQAAKEYKQIIDQYCDDKTDPAAVVDYILQFVNASFRAGTPITEWKDYAERAIKVCRETPSDQLAIRERNLHLILARAYGTASYGAVCLEQYELACALCDRYPLAEDAYFPEFCYSKQLRSGAGSKSEAEFHFRKAVKILRDYRHLHGQSIFNDDMYVELTFYDLTGQEQFWDGIAAELEREAQSRPLLEAVKPLVSAAWISSKLHRMDKCVQLFDKASEVAALTHSPALEAYTYHARFGTVPMDAEQQIEISKKAYNLVAPHADEMAMANSVVVAAYRLATAYADAKKHNDAVHYYQIACELDDKLAQENQKKGNVDEAWHSLYRLLAIDGVRGCWEMRQQGNVQGALEFAAKERALLQATRTNPAYATYAADLNKLQSAWDILEDGNRPY